MKGEQSTILCLFYMDMEARKLKISELTASLFFMIFSGYMLYLSYTTKVSMGAYSGRELSPYWFPKIVLIIMLTFSCICFLFTIKWFINNRRVTEKKVGFFEIHHKKSVITYCLLVVYALLWNVIGFSLSTVIYFSLQTKVMDKERSWMQIILISVVFTAGLVLLFSTLFNVKLPEPIIKSIF